MKDICLSTTILNFVSKDFTHLLSQAYPNWFIIRFVYVVYYRSVSVKVVEGIAKKFGQFPPKKSRN